MGKTKTIKMCLPFLIQSARLFYLFKFSISVISRSYMIARLPCDFTWILSGLFNLQFNISDTLQNGVMVRLPKWVHIDGNGSCHSKHSSGWQRGLWFSHMRAFMLCNNLSKGERIFVAKNCSSCICIYISPSQSLHIRL